MNTNNNQIKYFINNNEVDFLYFEKLKNIEEEAKIETFITYEKNDLVIQRNICITRLSQKNKYPIIWEYHSKFYNDKSQTFEEDLQGTIKYGPNEELMELNFETINNNNDNIICEHTIPGNFLKTIRNIKKISFNKYIKQFFFINEVENKIEKHIYTAELAYLDIKHDCIELVVRFMLNGDDNNLTLKITL